jgi:hypothetical protein
MHASSAWRASPIEFVQREREGAWNRVEGDLSWRREAMKISHVVTKLACLSLMIMSLAACDEQCSPVLAAPASNVTIVDIDGDGHAEITVTKQDGVTITEQDIDDDGHVDIRSEGEDSNGDGLIDISTTSISIKGVPLNEMTLIDFDGDGKFDVSVLRIDTDGDGTLDYEEHRRDGNGDGVPEQLYTPLG